LSEGLEELVLTGLCWHPELASAIAMQVSTELFTTRHYRTIARAAMEHLGRFGQPPRKLLPIILETELEKAEFGEDIAEQLTRMEQDADELQPEFIMARLDHFVQTNQIRLALSIANEHVRRSDPEKALQALHAIDYGRQMSPGLWLHEDQHSLSFLDKPEEAEFRLGIKALDERGVRPARKELLTIIAPKKRGKSMCLVGIGREAAYLDHHAVLHITLEMSAEQTAKRYVQAIGAYADSDMNLSMSLFRRDAENGYLGVDFTTITPKVLSRESRRRITQKLHDVTRGQRKLLIKEWATGQLSTAQLNMYLDYLKRAHNFVPDLVIIDYATLMAMNSNQIRTETGRIFRDLRGIAVVTAAQSNRASENSRIVGAHHVAEDWSILGTVDCAISICRTPEEKDKRLARLYVAAARNVPDQYMVQITQSFETCQFAVDSIYMNRVAIRDLDRLMANEGEDC